MYFNIMDNSKSLSLNFATIKDKKVIKNIDEKFSKKWLDKYFKIEKKK